MNGFLSLMLLQLLARLLTFTLNMLLYRIALLPSTVGRVQIQLDLTHQTLLFGAREGIRMALLRYKSTSSQPSPSPNTALSSKKGDLASAPTSTTPQTDGAPPLSTQGLINLAWIPLFIGFFLTLLYYIYHRSSYFYHPFTVAAEKVDDNDYMTTATIYYLISACVELAVEPAHALLTHHLLFAARSAVEGAAVLIKCLATFSLTWIALNQDISSENVPESKGVMAFAYAQLIYSFLLATGYLLVVLYTHRSICLKFQGSGNSFTNSRSSHGVQLSLWPQRWSLFNKNVSKYVYLEPASTSMAWTFTKQSWLKHCLTEGDKALLWWLTVPADQGAYAFANNLGSLVARIIFQPMEESMRSYFSKGMALASDSSRHHPYLHILSPLQTLIRFHILLAHVFLLIAPAYTHLLVHILGGSKWSTSTAAPSMLSAYCVYVPIMGLNGITEAFLQATADTPRLATHSRWMVIFSVVYLAVCIIAFNGLGLGSVGFVVANCWNLSVRFWVSWLYITGFEREHATITDHPSQTNEKSNHEENERKKESEGHQLRRRKLHGGSARSEGDTPVSSHEGKNNTLMKLQSIVPAWQVTITFVLAGAIVRISESLFMYKNNSFQVSFKESAAHIAIGGVCAILAGASIIRYERSLIANIAKLFVRA